MSNLVVITFDSAGAAGQVRKALREAQHSHLVSLDDSAVVVKDKDGQVQVLNEVDRGVKVGAIGGGLLGLIVGFVLGGPLASLALGAVAGALGGDLANLGIDQRFINNVSETLEPGHSALFLVVREAEPEIVVDVLEPYEGHVYYTSLPTEVENELRQILDEQSQDTQEEKSANRGGES